MAQSLDGIVLLNKPKGMRSLEADRIVKSIFGAERAGHLGTLDPDASGLLPIALNRATRFLPFLPQQRTYRVEVEGSPRLFVGMFGHWPPQPAAVRTFRRRRILSFEILHVDKESFGFRVEVEAGTYIRALAEQMGWRILSLHREAIGPLRPEASIEDLQSAPFSFLRPLEDFAFLPSVRTRPPWLEMRNHRIWRVHLEDRRRVFIWNTYATKKALK